MRLLTALCIAVAVVAFAVPAFAETQNVKVSGDIAIAHVWQKDIDLSDDCPAGVNSQNENDSQNFFIQQLGLNVGADLTDNVSTYVRIINERAWDALNNTISGAPDQDFDINIDEAYVTLKEMLYAPLTVKLGRQNIMLGRGFVIGNSGTWNKESALPGTIAEVSDMTAFDAIRATLNYDPWTIDLIYSKMDEQLAISTDDLDLYIANVGYKFTKYDAEAEAYWIMENNDIGRDGLITAATAEDANVTHTLGLRGSLVPFEHMSIWAEGAIQAGRYASDLTNDGNDHAADRHAGALDLGAEYEFADVNWTPTLGAEYVYLSGENETAAGICDGDWGGWNPLYSNRTTPFIAAFRNITKTTDFDNTADFGGAGVDTTANNNGATNENQIAIFGSIDPMADVKVDARWTYLWYDNAPRSLAVPSRDDVIGNEIDGRVSYDYTEDVSFAVAGAVFVPGDYYDSDATDTNQATAAQVISSVKVDF